MFGSAAAGASGLAHSLLHRARQVSLPTILCPPPRSSPLLSPATVPAGRPAKPKDLAETSGNGSPPFPPSGISFSAVSVS